MYYFSYTANKRTHFICALFLWFDAEHSAGVYSFIFLLLALARRRAHPRARALRHTALAGSPSLAPFRYANARRSKARPPRVLILLSAQVTPFPFPLSRALSPFPFPHWLTSSLGALALPCARPRSAITLASIMSHLYARQGAGDRDSSRFAPVGATARDAYCVTLAL